ncbi:hypothetical protein BX600DRAFT_88243 [Xylariales sp. PMI_506]|nr:hypothetical protein BX600DRAFT_88243 [Xylariales sp. PMI_506]
MEHQFRHRSIAQHHSLSQPAAQTLTEKYRRNGKLQACEPCRRSKLKCDHTVPICGRCIKRKCIDKCFYHPSPLTQVSIVFVLFCFPFLRIGYPIRDFIVQPSGYDAHNRDTEACFNMVIFLGRIYLGGGLTSIGKDRPNPRKRSLQTPSYTGKERPQSTGYSTKSPSSDAHSHASSGAPIQDAQEFQAHIPAASASELRPDPEPMFSKVQEFLGDTSYKSVFMENLGSLGVVSSDFESSEFKNNPVGDDLIAQGCRVLELLNSRRVVRAIVDRWYELLEGNGNVFLRSMVLPLLDNFWHCYGDVLERQEPKGIRQLCEQIWHNTQKPVVIDGNTSAMEWVEQMTGYNARWSLVGFMAALIGGCAVTVDPLDPIFRDHNITRKIFPKQMSEVSQACLRFSRECYSMDDIFVWHVARNACLTSALRGDDNFDAYQETGDFISAVISMGLHQELKANDRVPFFLSEIRKRLRSAAYCTEVSVASFLGRPPRTTHRHWDLSPPLDLLEQHLMLDREKLNPILAGLDRHGYRTEGPIMPITWKRAWLGLAPRREDILDLALSKYSREEVLQRAEMIRRQSKEHIETMPPAIRETIHGELPNTTSPTLLLYISVLRNGSRSNDMLLERVLMRKAGVGPEKLIEAACGIFKDVLEITQRADVITHFPNDVTSILVVHGLRSAAIIAIELLKQDQLPIYPKEPLLPRSQTIQDLSVFAARLGAIDPTEGTYAMCQQGRKIITLVLDKVLSQPQPQLQPQLAYQQQDSQMQQQVPSQMDVDPHQGSEDNAYMTLLGPYDLNMGGQDPNGADLPFMQWLDGLAWEREGQWISMCQ